MALRAWIRVGRRYASRLASLGFTGQSFSEFTYLTDVGENSGLRVFIAVLLIKREFRDKCCNQSRFSIASMAINRG